MTWLFRKLPAGEFWDGNVQWQGVRMKLVIEAFQLESEGSICAAGIKSWFGSPAADSICFLGLTEEIIPQNRGAK